MSSSPDPSLGPIRQKPMSAWVFVGGATVLASLTIAALIGVAVLVQPPPEKKSGGLQEQVMPDGTVLVLQNVTWGTTHNYSVNIGSRGLALFGGGFQRRDVAQTTPKDAMMLWFTRHDPRTRRSLDFDWWLRCVAFDEHGCPVEDEQPGRTAFSGHGNAGHGGMRPFSPDASSSGPRDHIVAYSMLRPLRHSGETIRLQVFDVGGLMVAEFDVPNVNPNRNSLPEWKPEPLPISRREGDLTATLTGLTASEYVHSYFNEMNGRQVEQIQRSITLSPQFRVTVGGKPAEEWNGENVQAFDALGNSSWSWGATLCPHESAWKLSATFFRREGSKFDPSELWTVQELAIPEEGQAVFLGDSATVQEVTLTLRAIGGSGKVEYAGLAPTGGGMSYGGSFDGGTFNINTTADRHSSSTKVECGFPHLVLDADGLTPLHKLTLQVTDQDGRKVEIAGPYTTSKQHYWFLKTPKETASVNITCVVQKGHAFDYFVQPPEITVQQPTPPWQQDENSRNQRLTYVRQQIGHLEGILAANPDEPFASGELAWLLAMGPDEVRDPERARRLMDIAQPLHATIPGRPLDPNPLFRTTHGLAYYRQNKLSEAAKIFEENASGRTDPLAAFDLYGLAMAQFQLGKTELATVTYNRAYRLQRESLPQLSVQQRRDLQTLRGEAILLVLGDDPQKRLEQADALARRGEWEPAAEAFIKLLDVYPDDHWHWYRSGPLQLYVGNRERYQHDCRQMLDLFGKSDGMIAERTGKLALLTPDAVPDDERPYRLIDRALAQNGDFSWFRLAKGMAEYRAGHWQDAIDWLERAEQTSDGSLYLNTLIDLFLAMSHHRLQQTEPARQRLAKATETIEQRFPKPGSDYGGSWHDMLMCHILHREAQALLNGDTK